MDNLIMQSIMNVFNSGISQIETDLTPDQLVSMKQELSERGYDCHIVKENTTKVVVRRKDD